MFGLCKLMISSHILIVSFLMKIDRQKLKKTKQVTFKRFWFRKLKTIKEINMKLRNFKEFHETPSNILLFQHTRNFS